MPDRPTSRGMVTWRSISSAEAPGFRAMISMMGGAGSGYASTFTLTNAYAPYPARARTASRTIIGLSRTQAINLRMVGRSQYNRTNLVGNALRGVPLALQAERR